MRAPSRRIIEFSNYWLTKAEAGRLPAFREILPEEVFRLLPNMVVWQVIDGGADFRCRLMGEALVASYGAELRGRLLSEVTAENPTTAVFATNLRRCTQTRRPLLALDHLEGHRGTPKTVIGVAAPLSSDGRTVTDICCCSVYVDHADAAEIDHALPPAFERVGSAA